ncbi:MAG: hypothetical protein L6R37_006692 [Teloschistes peruensis]|nr:MAG: hypothetical protein L6R37_006692 [Teloschistes peruensis]
MASSSSSSSAFNNKNNSNNNTPPSAPSLQVNGLPSSSESDSASSSPSTTTKPRNARPPFQAVLGKLRPAPFTHTWTFHHERSSPSSTAASADSYAAARFTTLLDNISTVKPFMEMLNHFPLANLKLRDSIHFFKRGVQPIWEDPRNARGGCWTFRVGKAQSGEFWKEVLYLAVGEQMGGVVAQGDDICGATLSRRFNSDLIQIWNRRADLQPSVDAIRDVVLAKLSDELKPKEGTYYYKRHSEHAGFAA